MFKIFYVFIFSYFSNLLLLSNFHYVIFSRESDSRIANVCLSVCLSVCQSVTKTPKPLKIAPIDHQAYQPSGLSTIEPTDHQAYQPLSLSTIEPIKHRALKHRAYQPSSLSTIIPIDHQAYPIK